MTLEHLNRCLKAAKMGVWEATLDKDSLKLQDLKWDEAILHMHGVSPDQEIAPFEWFCQNICTEDIPSLRQSLQHSLQKNNPAKSLSAVYRTRWPHGEIHSLAIYASIEEPGLGKNTFTLYGVAKDITQEVAKQKLLENQKDHILPASRMAMIADIAAGIAHEINNPLTVIQARSFQLTQMAEMGKLEAEKVKSAAESISKTGDRIAKIIKSLLKSIRTFAQGTEKEEVETLNVNQLIHETLDFCKARFHKQGIEIRIGELPENLEFECHLVQIEEALLNIFNNAHDAISKLPEKWILIEAFDKGKDIEIQVTDSGSGIADEIADQIMLPFFTTKKIVQGIGLGLSITAEIINKHHGVFFLDRSNSHTRFILRIPKVQPPPPPAEPKT